MFDDFEAKASKTKFGIPLSQLSHCIAAGQTYTCKGETCKLIDDETELVVIFADDTNRKQLYKDLVETAMAHVSDGDVLAVIASTTIRVTAIRELYKPVQLTCNQTNTMLIMAEESTKESMRSVENEHQRQNMLAFRRDTLKTKEKNMREALPTVVEQLSTFASEYISSRKLKQSQYLFKPALKHVLENNLGASKRLSWEERFDQLVQFKKKFNHCNVSVNDNTQLGLWVQRQRQSKNGTGLCKISLEQIDQLNSIGFKWSEVRKFSKKRLYMNM